MISHNSPLRQDQVDILLNLQVVSTLLVYLEVAFHSRHHASISLEQQPVVSSKMTPRSVALGPG
jgi:hypothetical protein